MILLIERGGFLMCGRFYVNDEENDELLDLIHDLNVRFSGQAKITKGEIRPSNMAVVLTPSKINHAPVPDSMRFGFSSSKSQVINARSESALQKPMFSSCVHNGRILIPASGFYEWDHTSAHAKYYFNRMNGKLMYMAGLCKICGDTECFVILTTAANDSMKEIHSRMPLILPDDKIDAWLYDDKEALNLLSYQPEPLKKTRISPPSSYEQMTLPFLS